MLSMLNFLCDHVYGHRFQRLKRRFARVSSVENARRSTAEATITAESGDSVRRGR
jgi:hypothetical protein